MKILVLGSEGQIGRPFCEMATNQNHTISKLDKNISPDYDLCKPSTILEEYIDGADVVLFLAFNVGGSKFLIENDKTFQYISENVKLMANVFEKLQKINKPFLFASSQMANMYHTNYGFLKDLGERYCRAMSNAWICRFWNVYGYEDPHDPRSHVITDFIHMAKTKKVIEMRTSGREERQFLHTDDCSEALLDWCINHKSYDKSEYIDITSFEWTSILEVARIISKKLNVEIEFGSGQDVLQREKKNTPSDYMRKFWSPKISLEEGIHKLI